MTEPPEPRRPEEDGGDEDYDAIWDQADADEIMGGLEDDAMLDSIRDGVRGDLGPDELTELLSELRGQPDATDIRVPLTARVERGENVLPPRSREGDQPKMGTTEENAALVRAQTAKVGEAAASLANALDLLADARNAAVGALGDIPSARALNAQVEGVRSALDEIQGRVMGLNQAFEDAAATGG